MAGLVYRQGDMRKLPFRWKSRFDVVFNLFSSFGFFLDPADDRRTVAAFSRSLKSGGVLVWHGGNRDVIATRFPARDWWTATDGTLITQERSFDPLSGILTVASSWNTSKRRMERTHQIRLYSPTHLAELFAEQGLVVEQAVDGDNLGKLNRRSSSMLLVARKD